MYILKPTVSSMDIIWDDNKNEWLQLNRSISFEEISGVILDRNYRDIIENPSREDQFYFILDIQEYTWVVPFLVDTMDRIILKTAFPSRRFHKRYGGKNE